MLLPVRRLLTWALLLAPLCLGCNESNVCGQSEEQVLRADGGEYRCTMPEDCPRSSDVFVCETNVPAEKACVSCRDTLCVLNVPVTCGSVQ